VASKTLKAKIGPWIVALLFTASGVLHLLNPQAFMWLMPDWLPFSIELILLSGVFELVAALGLLLGKPWGGYLAVATLLAVWPANWWFAIDALTNSPDLALAAWLRLPLQLPLIWWSWRVARPVPTK